MSRHAKDTATMILCLLGDLALINAEMDSNESILIPTVLGVFAVVAWMLPVFNITRRTLNILAVLGFLFFLVEYVLRPELQMLALTHFLIFIQGVFFLKAVGLLERYILITTSLIQFLAASILTEEIIFIVFFLAYLILSTPTLLRLGWARIGNPDRTLPRSLALKSSLLVIIPLAPLMVVLFLITPRFNLGMLADLNLVEYAKTGFANEIRLGSMRMILEDDSEVLRIEGPMMDVPYLRAKAYDTYTNSQWIQTGRRMRRLEPDAQGKFGIATKELPWTADNLIQHEITFTEQFEHTILPIPPLAVWVKYPALHISKDTLESVYLPSTPEPTTTYTTYSAPAQALWSAIAASRNENYPDAIKSRYCSVEPNLRVELRRLAQNLTAGKQTALDKVAAIKEYLTTNYSYSLEHLVPRSMDPIIHFLMFEKYGHCEYFASAMTLLLRSIDIPARLVSGFIVREPSADGSGYIVRQKDAHTWVEVYFPDIGWAQFDPTPADVRYEGESLRVKWLRFTRTVKARFRLSIIEYSQQQQLAVIKQAFDTVKDQYQSLGKSVLSIMTHAIQRLKDMASFGMLIVVILIIALLGCIAVMVLRPQVQSVFTDRRRFSSDVRRVRRAYVKSVKRFQRLGWQFHRSSTPEELVAALRVEDPMTATAADRLFSLYQAVRFGGRTPNIQQIESLSKELRKNSRRKQR